VRSYHKNDQRIRGLEVWLKHRELASRRLWVQNPLLSNINKNKCMKQIIGYNCLFFNASVTPFNTHYCTFMFCVTHRRDLFKSKDCVLVIFASLSLQGIRNHVYVLSSDGMNKWSKSTYFSTFPKAPLQCIFWCLKIKIYHVCQPEHL
jgi:hypothetical protein